MYEYYYSTKIKFEILQKDVNIQKTDTERLKQRK